MVPHDASTGLIDLSALMFPSTREARLPDARTVSHQNVDYLTLKVAS